MEVFLTHDNSIPANIKTATYDTKKDVLVELLDKFVVEYYTSSGSADNQNDHLLNYSRQLCEWGIHYLSLDDAAREGDLTRIQPNLQGCIPFFFSHSKLSKYMVECINYILQYKYASPLQKTRILEGSFINRRGGIGNNVEADLVQEHSVKHQKELIRGLGANKSQNAITRATSASNLLSGVISSFDASLNVPHKGGHRTSAANNEDVQLVREAMATIQPFRPTPGRRCGMSFHDSKFRVSREIILPEIAIIKRRIENGLCISTDDDAEEEEYDQDGLPNI